MPSRPAFRLIRQLAPAIGFLALALVPVGAQAQSSGCPASGPTTNIVCSDPLLARLADELLAAYRDAVAATERDFRPALLRQHREWNGSLEQCLGDRDPRECLRVAYEDRIGEVTASLAGYPPAGGNNDGGFAGDIPVERADLPPIEGGDTRSYERAPGAGAGQSQGEAQAGPQGGSAGNTPPRGGRPAAAEIAAAASAAGAGVAAESGSASARAAAPTPQAEVAATTPAAAPAPANATADTGTAGLLTANVWKAEVASGIRPGTIFIFQTDGTLVTADCVESYRLGTWALTGQTSLAFTGAGSAGDRAEIVSIRDRFVRLSLGGRDDPSNALVLRPADAPFACKAG